MVENKLTVIMSVFNETLDFLRESIDSILNQSYKNFEFIIVNDNPENNETEEFLRKYADSDSRIRLLINKQNIGLPRSLNRAIKAAQGEYIARMDADDISMENRLQGQVDFLDSHPDIYMVSGGKIDIDENSNVISTSSVFPSRSNKNLAEILPYGNPIVHPTVMIRKCVFDELAGYRDIKGGEDYDLWLRMLTKGFKLHTIGGKPVLKYRIRQDGITRSDFFWLYYSGEYSRKLYRERIRRGKDSYSRKNAEIYKNKLSNTKKCEAVNRICSVIGENDKKKAVVAIAKSVISSPSSCVLLKNLLLFKLKMRRIS